MALSASILPTPPDRALDMGELLQFLCWKHPMNHPQRRLPSLCHSLLPRCQLHFKSVIYV